MRKLYLTLAALIAAAAVGVGAVVALAQQSPQRTPASKKQARLNSSAPTAGGIATSRPSAPAKPTKPSNPLTGGG